MSEKLFPDLTAHHVGISVDDLEVSIRFWSDIMGFELEFTKDIPPIKTRLAFLRRDNFRMEIFEKQGASSTPETALRPNTDLGVHGTKHVCFCVDDVQAVLETLFEKNIEIVGIMRDMAKPMLQEEDPRLCAGPERPEALAFFFLAPSNILVEILARSSFAS